MLFNDLKIENGAYNKDDKNSTITNLLHDLVNDKTGNINYKGDFQIKEKIDAIYDDKNVFIPIVRYADILMKIKSFGQYDNNIKKISLYGDIFNNIIDIELNEDIILPLYILRNCYMHLRLEFDDISNIPEEILVTYEVCQIQEKYRKNDEIRFPLGKYMKKIGNEKGYILCNNNNEHQCYKIVPRNHEIYVRKNLDFYEKNFTF